MIPTSSNQFEYPQYYIIDVSDITDELMAAWDRVIAAEASKVVMQRGESEVHHILPDGTIATQMRPTMALTTQKPWHPDVSTVLMHVIHAVKQRGEIAYDLQMLEIEIAAMTHYQLTQAGGEVNHPGYSSTRMQLAKLASNYGHQVFQKLTELKIYQNDYFPYHFAGWHGTCVLVELDETHSFKHGYYYPESQDY